MRNLWSYSPLKGPGCVFCPTCLLKEKIIPRPASSPVEVLELALSLVSHSLMAAGRRPTPWGTSGMPTLAGPRPGVCCSWGVDGDGGLGLQPNC